MEGSEGWRKKDVESVEREERDREREFRFNFPIVKPTYLEFSGVAGVIRSYSNTS